MLNNRIFDGGEPKTQTTSIVTNGNAVNGNLKDEGENTESASIGTKGDKLPGGDEDEGLKDDVEEDTQEDDQIISPPALYHRTQKEMLGILGLVTHVDAQGIIEERDRNVKPLVKRLRNRKPKKK